MYMVIWWPTPSGRFKHRMHPGPHQRAFLFTGTCFVMRCFFVGSAFMNRQLDDQAVLGVLQKGRLHQSPGHIFPKDGESISVCAFAWPCMLSFVSTFQNFTMMVGTPKSRTDSCHHDGGLVGWPQEHGNQKRFKFTCCNCSLKIFLLVIPSTTRS